MDIDTAIVAFLEHRKARRRSPHTITQYDYHLNHLWQTWRSRKHHPRELTSITIEQLADFFTYLAEEHFNQRTKQAGLSPETINCAWRTLRAFWRFNTRRKWLTDDQKDFFQDDEHIPRPTIDQRMRPVLEDKTLQALLEACTTFNDTEERARNRALVLILAETGARVSEVVGMFDEKIRLDERCAAIIGKGNREEWIFWHLSGDRALRTYLNARSGHAGGPVFRRLTDSDGLISDDVRKILKTLAQIGGVELPEGATSHCFRHRFAHKAINAGLDATQVAQLMRHRDLETTFRYLRENRERLGKIRDRMG
jgi:integrase/recombinase XerD